MVSQAIFYKLAPLWIVMRTCRASCVGVPGACKTLGSVSKGKAVGLGVG